MGLKMVSLLILGLLVANSHADAFVEGSMSPSEPGRRFEPQVAMACDKHSQYLAQYMSPSGHWVTDPHSDVTCLKEKVDILQFCRQVYPNLNITNIVEASHFYKVSNFCRIGHNKCRTTNWVKPYRCLEGSFQSDALLVPEGCLFDHIHNQSRCWEFDQWNTTADQACQARGFNLKAFAMLLPCGIDIFSGVEFVCCPKDYKEHTKHHLDVEEPVALPVTDRRSDSKRPPASLGETTTPAQEVGTRDEYFSRFDPHEEHAAFRRAEQRLEDRHREKVSKIMKEWSDLEEHYQKLHEKNPEAAEEFRRRMTQRFQQTVQAVEAENEAERHQLMALHQQRIVAHINEMKREAMTCYTKALDAEQPNTLKVQKCLRKLLRSLNKDRHHTVSHFKHLLNSDYEAADRERDSTLQHLSDLDHLVNQSLAMLKKHPDLYAKIGRLMHEYAAALKSKDSTPPELTPQPPREAAKESKGDSEEVSDEEEEEDDGHSHEQTDGEEEKDVKDQNVSESSHQEGTNLEPVEHHEEVNSEQDIPDSWPSSPSSLVTNHEDENANEEASEGTKLEYPASGPEHLEPSAAVSAHQEDIPQVAHAQHHSFTQEQSKYSVTRDPRMGHESQGVYFTLAFAGVALMALLVVGIAILRRRSSRHPHSQGFIEVDQAATPEERHVTNMQVNGYENPTYKYFEDK